MEPSEHTFFSKSALTLTRRVRGLRPPGSVPARSEDPPCCLPGTPPGSDDRRGSCPSDQRSCPPSSAEYSRPRPPAADPETTTSQHQQMQAILFFNESNIALYIKYSVFG